MHLIRIMGSHEWSENGDDNEDKPVTWGADLADREDEDDKK